MKGQGAKEWARAMEQKHERIRSNNVWRPVLRKDVPHVHALSTTWAMKKKASRICRARVNTRGFKQIPNMHYNPNNEASPMVNITTIRIVLIL